MDFPSIYSRYKLEKSALEDDEDVVMRTYCGNDVVLLPPAAKKNSPFDMNVPYHMDGVEYIFDHALQRLISKNRPGAKLCVYEGFEDDDEDELEEDFAPQTKRPKTAVVGNSASHDLSKYYEDGLDHPLLLTEAPLMPKYARGYMMQLAYEAYGAGSLCFGIDSLFSLLYDHHHNYIGCRVTDSFASSAANSNALIDSLISSNGLENRSNTSNGASSDLLFPDTALVLSSGLETTHVMPVMGGRMDNAHIARIGIGGHHVTESLNRSVQLLYPQHKAAWAKLQPSAAMCGLGYAAAEAVKEQECFVASPSYTETLRAAQSGQIEPSFWKTFQFAYEPRPIVTISEEERKARESKRLENAERLKEMSRRKKEEKLVQKSNRLDVLENLFTARADSEVTSGEMRALLRRAGFNDADDESTAALGGPRDRVVQEIAEIRKYLDRFADDTIQAERQASMQLASSNAGNSAPSNGESSAAAPNSSTPPTPWTEMTLEAKLATMDTRLPLTIIDDEDLSEIEQEMKRGQMKVKQMALTKIRRGHERALAKAANAGASSTSNPASKATKSNTFVIEIENEDGEDAESGAAANADGENKRGVEITLVLDMSKDLSVFGLEELQLQRKGIQARLQKRQKALKDRRAELKDASEEANKAKVEDIANFSSVLQGNSNSPAIGGPASGGSSMNGVGSIANAIGARSSRAKKADMMMFRAAADARMDMDPESLERLSILRMDHPDMVSVKASQKESELKQIVEAQLANVESDKSLLEKVDDEILMRLEPEVLRQREAESYQLILGVNRIRCPELLFQPSIIGIDQMGLPESIQSILARVPSDYDIVKRKEPTSSWNSSSNSLSNVISGLKADLINRIYITGGNGAFPHLTSRLHAALGADLPAGSKIRVIQASSPTHCAWKGAALFSNNPVNQKRYFVPIETYQEEGADRLHERFLNHFASNRT